MRLVLQRVKKASVKVEGKTVGQIEKGVLLLVGFCKGDENIDLERVIHKIINLRIFPDKEGKTNLSLKEIQGEILVVSQFTLCANTQKGHRPSFLEALEPERARKLYEEFLQKLRETGLKIESGIFGAFMEVELRNEGPFTLVLEF